MVLGQGLRLAVISALVGIASAIAATLAGRPRSAVRPNDPATLERGQGAAGGRRRATYLPARCARVIRSPRCAWSGIHGFHSGRMFIVSSGIARPVTNPNR